MSLLLARRDHRAPLFVGREEELEWFHETLVLGNSRGVVVEGEAGIGKSWLANEFARRAKDAFPGGVREYWVPEPQINIGPRYVRRRAGFEVGSLLSGISCSAPSLLILEQGEALDRVAWAITLAAV